jgi:predicted Mrr-cat superfamily restriction endonuclease
MSKELKKAIINWMFDNSKEFQLINATAERFRSYIYDDKGNYLIAGKDIMEFIRNADKLIF